MRSNRARSSSTETVATILILMVFAGLAYSHFHDPKYFKTHYTFGVFADR